MDNILTNIDYLQYFPAAGTMTLKWRDGTAPKTVSADDVQKDVLDKLAEALSTLRTAEEKALDDAKSARVVAEEAREKAEADKVKAEAKLKAAQDALAKMMTGDDKATMTDEVARLYPELVDGMSIDAGDYCREQGGKVLYRAKRDMVYDHTTMAPTGEYGADYWTGAGNDKQPEPKVGVKYPKGTEVDYMGARYYATVDTNDGPETGYPTWDLAQNKPQN
ncbi:hypothetical protein [Murdochiella massiliensis]|uniref:hypothetical protein n=1 Tax=Murdochiella massiliensis TaxID=1673723 RepID=UPI00082CACF6|nr:hypothetical protein [Murdochiella massiliensis]